MYEMHAHFTISGKNVKQQNLFYFLNEGHKTLLDLVYSKCKNFGKSRLDTWTSSAVHWKHRIYL